MTYPKIAWPDCFSISRPPDVRQQRIVPCSHDSFRAFPIVLLHIVLPSVVQEETGEGQGSAQTLNGSIHVARYTKVDQSGAR